MFFTEITILKEQDSAGGSITSGTAVALQSKTSGGLAWGNGRRCIVPEGDDNPAGSIAIMRRCRTTSDHPEPLHR